MYAATATPSCRKARASRERTTETLDRAVQIEHRRPVLDRARRDEIGHVTGLDAAGRQDSRDQRRDAVGGDEVDHVRQDPAAERDEAHDNKFRMACTYDGWVARSYHGVGRPRARDRGVRPLVGVDL